MENNILSVSQINEYLRSRMDADPFLNSVAISGEISNYKLYPSGHHYFTIKDENAALKCVLFKGNALRLRFRPENGMKVIALGKISVYPRDGAYQLYCTNLNLDGVGDLHIAFEQLKKKLEAQGLFDTSRKQQLPKYPKYIGIITSEAGAAVRDMLRIINERFPLSKVRLIPVRVQGAEAPTEIAAAISYANYYKLADVLIVGRGGGSIEDLWAFNEEIVARAIFESTIPIISAVGHEPDVTISDYVADQRAATPSNAAEIVVPDQNSLRLSLDVILNTLASSLNRQIKNSRTHLNALATGSALKSPYAYIDSRKNALRLTSERMRSSYEHVLYNNRQRFLMHTAKLDALSPLKVLSRGYSVIKQHNGALVRSINNVKLDETIEVVVSDGAFTATVDHIKESGI